jgi:hypothetical protein
VTNRSKWNKSVALQALKFLAGHGLSAIFTSGKSKRLRRETFNFRLNLCLKVLSRNGEVQAAPIFVTRLWTACTRLKTGELRSAIFD